MNTDTAIPETASVSTSTLASPSPEAASPQDKTIRPSSYKQETRSHFQQFYKNWVVYQIIKMMAKNEDGNGDRWVSFTQRTLIANLDPESGVRAALECLDVLTDEDGIFDKVKNPESDHALETSFYSVNEHFFSIINPLT